MGLLAGEDWWEELVVVVIGGLEVETAVVLEREKRVFPEEMRPECYCCPVNLK